MRETQLVGNEIFFPVPKSKTGPTRIQTTIRAALGSRAICLLATITALDDTPLHARQVGSFLVHHKGCTGVFRASAYKNWIETTASGGDAMAIMFHR